MRGIGQLGSTTDPVALVPGTVEALHADADDMRSRATELADNADGPISRAVTSWVSVNATASTQNRAALAGELNAVADVYRAVGIVLDAHAEVLAWGQRQAQVAIELWAEGVRRGVASGSGVLTPAGHARGPFGTAPEAFPATDAGASLRRMAQAALGEARREVRCSQVAAARVLDDFSDAMPDGQFHVEDFLGGVGDWFTRIASLVWRFNTIRLAVDGDAMIDDARQVGQGVWGTAAYLTDDPTQAVPVLLNTQLLADRPGRWWGQMAPDIALAVAGGYGALSRSGTLARIGDDLAELAADTAPAAADAALAAGRTTGAAAELRVGGQVFTDVSTGGAPRVLNGSVQAALDAVPFAQRAPWHGACAEMGSLSQALDAGVNPAGGMIRAVAIGTSNPGHGLPKVICTSCSAVLDVFRVGR
ncbi:MAG: hypothetical protein HGA44_10830 [Cellulomonadaceae bacterium]|nr:hypothetical protein [Cellulomonadaceae bacterium]